METGTFSNVLKYSLPQIEKTAGDGKNLKKIGEREEGRGKRGGNGGSWRKQLDAH